MEASGKVTFLLKEENEPIVKSDMNIETVNPGLTANLVMDGNIMYDNLKSFGKDKRWLYRKIKEQGYSIKDIFLLVCNNSGEVTIYDKNYEINKNILE